ncbi:MAG: hypothetical protein GY811_16275 [Myxococcales bacterium]|nr:hypothetical protein [Myxococcales bacterium]
MDPEIMILRQVLVEESTGQGGLHLPVDSLAKKLGGLLVTSGYLASRQGDAPDKHRTRQVEAFLRLGYD